MDAPILARTPLLFGGGGAEAVEGVELGLDVVPREHVALGDDAAVALGLLVAAGPPEEQHDRISVQR